MATSQVDITKFSQDMAAGNTTGYSATPPTPLPGTVPSTQPNQTAGNISGMYRVGEKVYKQDGSYVDWGTAEKLGITGLLTKIPQQKAPANQTLGVVGDTSAPLVVSSDALTSDPLDLMKLQQQTGSKYLDLINQQRETNKSYLNDLTKSLLPSDDEKAIQSELLGYKQEQDNAIANAEERTLDGAVLTGAVQAEQADIAGGKTRDSMARLRKQTYATEKLRLAQEQRQFESSVAEAKMNYGQTEVTNLFNMANTVETQQTNFLSQVMNLRTEARGTLSMLLDNFKGLTFNDLSAGSKTSISQLADRIGVDVDTISQGMQVTANLAQMEALASNSGVDWEQFKFLSSEYRKDTFFWDNANSYSQMMDSYLGKAKTPQERKAAYNAIVNSPEALRALYGAYARVADPIVSRMASDPNIDSAQKDQVVEQSFNQWLSLGEKTADDVGRLFAAKDTAMQSWMAQKDMVDLDYGTRWGYQPTTGGFYGASGSTNSAPAPQSTGSSDYPGVGGGTSSGLSLFTSNDPSSSFFSQVREYGPASIMGAFLSAFPSLNPFADKMVKEGYSAPEIIGELQQRGFNIDSSSTTLAARNNNPGNLKYGGKFAQFESPSAGWDALANDLYGKMTGNTQTRLTPKSTLLDLFSVWAPASDNNNPTQYAQFIAREVGVSPYTSIGTLTNKIPEIAGAIAKMEGYYA